MAEVVSRSDLLYLPLFQPGQSPIQMEDKACLIADREDNETIQEDSLAFVMGPVNHMPLKRFVLNNMHMFKGNNQHDNVRLVRPAHDRWGVGKIMFKFCDDFMLRMFEFPWWHKRAWGNVLEPLFEELGIPPHRIVRCLLAQLPPNVNIPVHHDTGLWVCFPLFLSLQGVFFMLLFFCYRLRRHTESISPSLRTKTSSSALVGTLTRCSEWSSRKALRSSSTTSPSMR